MKNVLLLKGGGGSEHDVSLVSAKYLKDQVQKTGHKVVEVLIDHDKSWTDSENNSCVLNHNRELINLSNGKVISKIDFCIPCFHGFPGETGEIPSLLELYKIPYLGCGPEASILCFNKISTKLWFNQNGIPNVPFAIVENLEQATSFLNQHSDIYVKASNQGSSVGCYHVTDSESLKASIEEASKLSPYVLLEKTIKGRELEISTFEYQGEVHATKPGEIVCPDGFYDYEEKYSNNSKTVTHVEAKDLSEEVIAKIQGISKKAFKLLNLKDLSRIDFFYTNTGEIYLNEINTFPGMTPISMFPKMMENSGVIFSDFIAEKI